MIRIINKECELLCYKRLAELKGGSVAELPPDNDLFYRAGRLFEQGYILLKTIVSSSQEEKEIYLINTQDKIVDCGGNCVDVNINADINSLEQNENLDFSLIEKFDLFVFEELDEYTFKIARLLTTKFYNKVVYFIDSNADYLLGKDRVTVVADFPDFSGQILDKILYVTSSDVKRKKDVKCVHFVYSSIQVMSSLCWASKVKHLGYRKQTAMLINIRFDDGCGLGFIIRAVSVLITMALERNWTPVVKIVENMYRDHPDHNIWDQYFQQNREYASRNFSDYENVIDLEENYFSQLAIYYNPYFMELWQHPEKHVKPQLKNEMLNEFNERLCKPLTNQTTKVLGVLLRGTDASNKASEIQSIHCMMTECRKVMESQKFDYLFLATEDKNIFDYFIAEFQNRLLYVEQKRVCMDAGNKCVIGKMLDIQAGNKEQFAKDYLYITYCLSKCNALMFNMKSGGYYLTKLWMRAEYEFEKQLRYELSEIEKLNVICEKLHQGKTCVIYGTGAVCCKILKFIGEKLTWKLLEFCDAKAEKEYYEYQKKRVMCPHELLEAYRHKKVDCIMIASSVYADDIRSFLLKNGVQIQDTLIFRDSEGILSQRRNLEL